MNKKLKRNEYKLNLWSIVFALTIISCSSQSSQKVTKQIKKIQIKDTLMFESKNANLKDSFRVKKAILKTNFVVLNAKNKIDPIWINSIHYVSNNGKNIFAIVKTPSNLTGFFQYVNDSVKITYVNDYKSKVKAFSKRKFTIILYEDNVTSFEQESKIYKLFYLNTKNELVEEFNFSSIRNISSKKFDLDYEFIDKPNVFIIKENGVVIKSF